MRTIVPIGLLLALAACGGGEDPASSQSSAHCDELLLHHFTSVIDQYDHRSPDGDEILGPWYLYFNREQVQWRHEESHVDYIPYTCDAEGIRIGGEPATYDPELYKLTWSDVEYVRAADE